MANPATKLASYDDLFDLPENLVGEIIHGQLYASPRPAPKHVRASSTLGGELFNPYHKSRGEPGGWVILDEPELHLGADILVPDLAGWRREHLPELPDAPYFELVPDWVCEVLSPSTARLDRTAKMTLYAQNAVQYLWLVDPDLQMLEAYELLDGRWVLIVTLSGDDPVSVRPFDATSFPLSSLWY